MLNGFFHGRTVLGLALLPLLAACGNSHQVSWANEPDAQVEMVSSQRSLADDARGARDPVELNASIEGYIANYRYPLLWEHTRREGSTWTNWTYQIIRSKAPALLNGSRDISRFCPGYYRLGREQRENFWGLLVSAMTRYESNHNPLDRYHETSMGEDRMTGMPTYSEGLLQLSYQDSLTYPFCRFSWKSDSRFSPLDPRRTILNPYANLECGIQILNQQVARYGVIARQGGYWSILRPESAYTKLGQIQSITRAMPGCL